jgi:hypothetical protein
VKIQRKEEKGILDRFWKIDRGILSSAVGGKKLFGSFPPTAEHGKRSVRTGKRPTYLDSAPPSTLNCNVCQI